MSKGRDNERISLRPTSYVCNTPRASKHTAKDYCWCLGPQWFENGNALHADKAWRPASVSSSVNVTSCVRLSVNKLIDISCESTYSQAWSCGRVVEGAPLLRSLHKTKHTVLSQLDITLRQRDITFVVKFLSPRKKWAGSWSSYGLSKDQR